MKKYKMLIATVVALVFIASPVFQGNALGTAAIEYDLQQNGLVFIQFGNSEEAQETVSIMRSELGSADAPTAVYVVYDEASFLRIFEMNPAKQIALVGHGFENGMGFGDTASETGDVLAWSAFGNAINSRSSSAPVHIVSCNSFNVNEFIENADNVIAPYAGNIGTKLAAKISSIGFFLTKGQQDNAISTIKSIEAEDIVNPEAFLGSQNEYCESNYKNRYNQNMYLITFAETIIYWLLTEVLIHTMLHPIAHVLAALLTIVSTIAAISNYLGNIWKLYSWGFSSSVDLKGRYVCSSGTWGSFLGIETFDIEMSEKYYAYDDDGYPYGKKIKHYVHINGIYQFGSVVPYHASSGWTTW